MKALTILTILAGTALIAGCTHTTGVSISEDRMIDNNCSGGGGFMNEAWCDDTLHPSMGPRAGM